jgi:hypothetical protein
MNQISVYPERFGETGAKRQAKWGVGCELPP